MDALDVFVGRIMINYDVGDEVTSYDNPNEILGVCTGFRHNNTCIDIDGKCWGGKQYFVKSEWVECEIIY